MAKTYDFTDCLKPADVKKFPVPYLIYKPDQREKIAWPNEEIVSYNGPKDFDYYLNPYGFRWTLQDKPKILFNGCSHTFGQGVRQEDTFGEIICREYLKDNYECMNLGQPGTGIQIQSINLCWALNTFDDIEAVVWYLPTPARQIMVQHNAIHTYHPGVTDWFYDKKFAKAWDRLQPNIWETTQLNSYWSLYNTFSLIKQKGIRFLFKCWDGPCNTEFRRLRKDFKYVEIPDMPKLDHGRDWVHRGVETHRRFAEMIWKAWNES